MIAGLGRDWCARLYETKAAELLLYGRAPNGLLAGFSLSNQVSGSESVNDADRNLRKQVSFEWTNGGLFASNAGSILPFRTNCLIHQ
jgi:hypothetical protein